MQARDLLLDMTQPSLQLDKLLAHIYAQGLNVAANYAKLFKYKTFNVGHSLNLSVATLSVK